MRNIHSPLLILCLTLLFNIESHGQWERTNGPWGATAISCFAGNNEKLYAGSESKGVFISTDQGSSWKSINTDLPDTNVLSLLNIGNTIYAGTYNQLFISTNNGESWNYSGSGIPPQTRIYSLALFDSILFAGTSGGAIYRSIDYGNSWAQVFSGISTAVTKSFAENDGKLFAAIYLEGIFTSNDNGITWEESFSTLGENNSIVVKDGVIISGNLFISKDNGDNWEVSDLFIYENISDFAVIDSFLYAGTSNGVYVSTDNGKDWKSINKGLPAKNIFTLYTFNKMLFVSNLSYGIFRSTDFGSSWHSIDLRYNEVIVNSLITYENNLYAGTVKGVFRSDDYGSNWIPINTGLSSNIIRSLASTDNCIFAGTINGIFKSIDNGLNWIEANSDLNNADVRVLAASDSKIYYANWHDTIYVSSNNGDDWFSLVPLGFLSLPSRPGISSIAILDSNLFVGTSNWGVYRSTNGGLKWNQINNGLTDLRINTIYVNKNNIYVGNSDGVFLSTDNGNNWQSLNRKTQDFSINSILTYESEIFASNGYDVYTTSDNGIHWLNTGIKDLTFRRVYPSSLIIQDSILFAGSHNSGVWSRPISDLLTDINEEEPQLPLQFLLSQNYPNPFNPLTSIEYQVSISIMVTLKVYDLLGNEIATLINERKAPGNYKIEFNGRNLSSGIYFYKISAGNYHKVRKMILLK